MWTEENHINNVQASVDKLTKVLTANGITFQPTDGHLSNVVFTMGDKTMKLAHSCFYGFSRMAGVLVHYGKSSADFVTVTDELHINVYMKAMILQNFLPEQFGGIRKMVPFYCEKTKKLKQVQNSAYFYVRGELYKACSKSFKKSK